VSPSVQQLQLFTTDEPGTSPGFSVRRSSRAKRLSIKVYPRGRVEVVAPRRASVRAIDAFVAENHEWIASAKRSFAAHFTPASFVLPDIIRLPAVDRQVIVSYRPGDGSGTVRFRFSHGILTLSGNTGDEDACVKAIQRWLASVAKREFSPRLAELSALTGLSYSRMHVRMQRSCWGSRSSSGTISLNLCLLFVAPELLRYLLIHELSHGRHMNHSKRFWQLVGRHEPRYRQLDRQLGEAWKVVPPWLGIY
jgi:predicted metal-dependent hydrolase